MSFNVGNATGGKAILHKAKPNVGYKNEVQMAAVLVHIRKNKKLNSLNLKKPVSNFETGFF